MDRKRREHDPLSFFAEMLGTNVENGEIRIPIEKGEGYIRGARPNRHMGLLFFNFRLKEKIEYQDLLQEDANDEKFDQFRYLLFQFRGCMADDTVPLSQRFVQISTMCVNMEEKVLESNGCADLYITIDSDYLLKQIPCYDDSPILKSILFNDRPLFFEHSISKVMQDIINEIVDCKMPEALKNYFLTTEVDELICRLLAFLSQRPKQTVYPISDQDLKAVYGVRDTMIEKLNTPPVIAQLAKEACMSESKLKRLFRQVFGDSIFNYYQMRRIQRAAQMLKEGYGSISDVGYALGFTNLSHFTRIFERTIGMKPKAFSKQQEC